MKYMKTVIYLLCVVLTGAFLSACADMQTSGADSGYSDYSGGQSGGHHH